MCNLINSRPCISAWLPCFPAGQFQLFLFVKHVDIRLKPYRSDIGSKSRSFVFFFLASSMRQGNYILIYARPPLCLRRIFSELDTKQTLTIELAT